MHRIAITTVLFLAADVTAGCASAHEPPSVSTGIYELTVRGEGDACDPSRATGPMGAVGILVRGGVIDVGVPEERERIARVSLSSDTGFATEVSIDVAGCPGATVRRSWSLVDAPGDAFAIALSEEWSGVAGCEALAMPAADCRADRVLEYALAEPCGAPCVIGLGGASPVCTCD